MEIQPVDLTALAAVVLGSLVVLIPIMGATARLAAKPLFDALAQSGLLAARTHSPADSELGRLSRRVLELEQELAKVKGPAVTDPRVTEQQPVELRRVRT